MSRKEKTNNVNWKTKKGFIICTGVVVIFLIVTMIITPIIIHVKSEKVCSEITADGLLGYLGNCLAVVPTIILALVAIWQTNRANKIAEEANQCALESEEIAKNAIKLSEYSIEQTDISNDISKQLLELEENRQKLDMRPSFVVTKWRAPIKNFNSICINPDCLSIQVGEYTNGEAWGIELELYNISNGFESICFNEAKNINGQEKWANCMLGMSTRKIELPALKKERIYFYADKSFWEGKESNTYIVDFYIRNRIDVPYREKFEMMIMSMNDKVVHKDEEVYLHLEIQNYSVGEMINKCSEYPDGIEWDK